MWSLTDVFPPYFIAEGALDEKLIAEDGRLIVRIDKARLTVDQPTFDQLSVGEYLRIRYTRGARAISIDLYVSQNGHPPS